MQQRTRLQSDRVFLILILTYVIIGLAVLFSAGVAVGYAKFGDVFYFGKRQVLFGLLPGIAFALLLLKLNLQKLRKLSWFIYLFSILLLALVFVPGIGLTLNNSQSWIKVWNITTFQPAEFSKFALIFIFAYLLSRKRIDWSNWQASILPILAIAAPTVIMIGLQPDIGTLTIIAAIMITMLFVGKTPPVYIFSIIAVAIISFVVLIASSPYRSNRITVLLHPELDPNGIGYQMNQAYLAVGSGGFWGLGFGHSRQKFQYLPEVSADTIFAVYAEELGFIFSSLLIILIIAILFRGFKIAKGCHDEFGALLVTGIMVWFGWQSFLNISATIGVLPLTGVPLPLISHGGSAYIVTLAALALVLNVSRESVIN